MSQREEQAQFGVRSHALGIVSNPTKSPFHKWMTVTIYSVRSAAKDGGALQQEGAQSTCHHRWDLSCKSKGLPNTTTNTRYINREETSVYFMVLLSSD